MLDYIWFTYDVCICTLMLNMVCVPSIVCAPQALETQLNATYTQTKKKFPYNFVLANPDCNTVPARWHCPGGCRINQPQENACCKRCVLKETERVYGKSCAWPAGHRIPWTGQVTGCCQCYLLQDCFLQKEARVCVNNAFVLEDSKFKWCFFCCGRWTRDRGSRCANVNIVVEWKGIVSWGYCGVKWLRKQCCENNKRFVNCTESSICSVLWMLAWLLLYAVFS